MKDFINRWMTRQASCPGILACGVRHPDETTFHQALASGLSSETLEASWTCIADAFNYLGQQGSEATRLCWAFEKHRVYAAVRPDGACLGVITQPNQADVDLVMLDRMLSEFRSLRAPGRVRRDAAHVR